MIYEMKEKLPNSGKRVTIGLEALASTSKYSSSKEKLI